MGNQHHTAAQALHKRFQLGQAVQVQVIGGLIQQHDVEPAQQQGGERHARGLSAGEPGHLGLGADVQAKVREDRRYAFIQVRGAEAIHRSKASE